MTADDLLARSIEIANNSTDVIVLRVLERISSGERTTLNCWCNYCFLVKQDRQARKLIRKTEKELAQLKYGYRESDSIIARRLFLKRSLNDFVELHKTYSNEISVTYPDHDYY